jgi:RNA polymerase sigma-70 factor (ECF subfamily)
MRAEFAGGSVPEAFTSTRWSQVSLAGGATPEARVALDWLCRAYWEPLRLHASRRGWRDAEDAVQDFWLAMLERGSLAKADQARGRFRTFLLACLDHHLADRHAARQALKRGGGVAVLSESEEVPSVADNPELDFDRAWAVTLLQRARDRFMHEQEPAMRPRMARLECFLDHNGDAPAYAAAGAELAMSEGAVKVAVHRMRARFRASLRDEVAETLADPTPSAIETELDDLLAALRRV